MSRRPPPERSAWLWLGVVCIPVLAALAWLAVLLALMATNIPLRLLRVPLGW